tara:strand:+ start:554 stop:1453 length:900 start_codon:yes stop_codon:yes gene_type:complete
MEVNNKSESYEIFEIFLYIFSKKWLLIKLGFLFAISLSIIALLLPKEWESDAILVNVDSGTSPSQSGSALGGIAQLAGINLNTSTASRLNMSLYTILSRDFFRHLVSFENVKRDLIAIKSFNEKLSKPIYDDDIYDLESKKWMEEPTFFKSYEAYRAAVSAAFLDDKAGQFLVVRVKHRSPIFAKQLVDLIVQEVNELQRYNDIEEANASLAYLQDQLNQTEQLNIKTSISSLIENQIKTKMFANVRSHYVLKPIDNSYIPELRSSPQRTRFVLSYTFFGMLISVLVLLIRFQIKKFNS